MIKASELQKLLDTLSPDANVLIEFKKRNSTERFSAVAVKECTNIFREQCVLITIQDDDLASVGL